MLKICFQTTNLGFLLPDSPLGAFSTCTTRCDDRAARGCGCVLPRRTNWRQARSWRHISGALSSMRDRVQDVLPARKRRVRTVFLAVAPVDHKRAEQRIGCHRLKHRDRFYSHVRGHRLTGTVGQESAAWAADWLELASASTRVCSCCCFFHCRHCHPPSVSLHLQRIRFSETPVERRALPLDWSHKSPGSYAAFPKHF
jgi:hypothetical protein